MTDFGLEIKNDLGHFHMPFGMPRFYCYTCDRQLLNGHYGRHALGQVHKRKLAKFKAKLSASRSEGAVGKILNTKPSSSHASAHELTSSFELARSRGSDQGC